MTLAGAAERPDAGHDRLVDRVGKLLAQAEGTDNEHEAAAFVERAQALATAYAVDLERARRRQADRGRGSTAAPLVQERIEIGPRGQRGNRHRVLLYAAVAGVNDVRVNVASDSSYVLAFGTRADLDVVERLWASLAVQMTAAAQCRLDRGEHRAQRVAAMTWRLSFYDGFAAAVARRLRDARDRAVTACERTGAAATGEASAALVLRAKADRVDAFYRSASQARGTWRGTASGRTRVSGAAQRSGLADGERADLGQSRLRPRGRLSP